MSVRRNRLLPNWRLVQPVLSDVRFEKCIRLRRAEARCFTGYKVLVNFGREGGPHRDQSGGGWYRERAVISMHRRRRRNVRLVAGRILFSRREISGWQWYEKNQAACKSKHPCYQTYLTEVWHQCGEQAWGHRAVGLSAAPAVLCSRTIPLSCSMSSPRNSCIRLGSTTLNKAPVIMMHTGFPIMTMPTKIIVDRTRITWGVTRLNRRFYVLRQKSSEWWRNAKCLIWRKIYWAAEAYMADVCLKREIHSARIFLTLARPCSVSGTSWQTTVLLSYAARRSLVRQAISHRQWELQSAHRDKLKKYIACSSNVPGTHLCWLSEQSLWWFSRNDVARSNIATFRAWRRNANNFVAALRNYCQCIQKGRSSWRGFYWYFTALLYRYFSGDRRDVRLAFGAYNGRKIKSRDLSTAKRNSFHCWLLLKTRRHNLLSWRLYTHIRWRTLKYWKEAFDMVTTDYSAIAMRSSLMHKMDTLFKVKKYSAPGLTTTVTVQRSAAGGCWGGSSGTGCHSEPCMTPAWSFIQGLNGWLPF